jgi:hypothetical protein
VTVVRPCVLVTEQLAAVAGRRADASRRAAATDCPDETRYAELRWVNADDAAGAASERLAAGAVADGDTRILEIRF